MKTALLFDLDGTLVDTDALHLVAFQQVFARHGVSLTRAEYIDGIMGNSNPRIGARFLPHLTPAAREAALEAKEEAFRDQLGALTPVAGLVALLDFADAQGLRCAVVTNAPRANADGDARRARPVAAAADPDHRPRTRARQARPAALSDRA